MVLYRAARTDRAADHTQPPAARGEGAASRICDPTHEKRLLVGLPLMDAGSACPNAGGSRDRSAPQREARNSGRAARTERSVTSEARTLLIVGLEPRLASRLNGACRPKSMATSTTCQLEVPLLSATRLSPIASAA